MRFKLLVVFIVLTFSAVNHGQMLQQIGVPLSFVPKIPFGLLQHRQTTKQSGLKIKTTALGNNSTAEIQMTTESIAAETDSTTVDTPENAE